MRIVHAIEVLAPVGGAQSHVRRLVELQAVAGHDVSVVHSDEAPPPLGVRTFRATDGDTRAFVRRFDPEVVHVHDLGLPFELEAELAGERPVVRSIHDLGYTCAAGTRWYRNGSLCTRPHGPGCLAAMPLRGCAHRLDPRPLVAGYRELDAVLPRLRATKATLASSEYMASLLRANGFAAESIGTVPYFVEPPLDPSPVPPERIVCFVGRVVRNKGLDLLLRALAHVTDAWDGLIVCGDGWDLVACRRLAARLGIADRVDFRGWTEHAEALAAVASARMLALPSRWPEPFGIVGLEAMARRRPVVATRGGGVPEWLDDGRTGLLVEPGDEDALAAALERVLSDGDLAARLGDEGRERASLYSPASHLERLEHVYSSAGAPATVAVP